MSQPPRPTSSHGKKRTTTNQQQQPPSFTLDPSLENVSTNEEQQQQDQEQQNFTFPFERMRRKNEDHGHSNTTNSHPHDHPSVIVSVEDPSLETSYNPPPASSPSALQYNNNNDDDQQNHDDDNDRGDGNQQHNSPFGALRGNDSHPDVFYVERQQTATSNTILQQRTPPPRSPTHHHHHLIVSPSNQYHPGFPSSSLQQHQTTTATTILTFENAVPSTNNNNLNNEQDVEEERNDQQQQHHMYNPRIDQQDLEWQHQHQRYLSALQQQQHHLSPTSAASGGGGNNNYHELPPRTPPHTQMQLTPPMSSRSVISIEEAEDYNNNNNENNQRHSRSQETDEEDDDDGIVQEVTSHQSSTTTNEGYPFYASTATAQNQQQQDFIMPSILLSGQNQNQNREQRDDLEQQENEQTDIFVRNDNDDEHENEENADEISRVLDVAHASAISSVTNNNNNPRSAKRLRELLEGTKQEYFSFAQDNNLMDHEKKENLINQKRADLTAAAQEQTDEENNTSALFSNIERKSQSSISRQRGSGDNQRLEEVRDVTLSTIKDSLAETGDKTTTVRSAVWDALEENQASHNLAPNSIHTLLAKQQLRDIHGKHFTTATSTSSHHIDASSSPSSSARYDRQKKIESDFILPHHNKEGIQNVYDKYISQLMANGELDESTAKKLQTIHPGHDDDGSFSSSPSTSQADVRWSQFCAHMLNTVSTSLLTQQQEEAEKERKLFANRKAVLSATALTPTPKVSNAFLSSKFSNLPFSSSSSPAANRFSASSSSASSSTMLMNNPSDLLSNNAYATINVVKQVLNETTIFLKSEARLSRLVESEHAAAKDVIREAKEEAKQAKQETLELQEHAKTLKEEIATLHSEIERSKGKVQEMKDVRHKLQLGIARTATKVLGSVRKSKKRHQKNKKKMLQMTGDRAERRRGTLTPDQSLRLTSSSSSSSSDASDNDDNQNESSTSSSPISVKEKDPNYYVDILESVAAEAFQLRIEMDAALFIATQQTEWAIKEGQEAEKIVNRLSTARDQLTECSSHMLTMRNYIAKLEQQLGPLQEREFILQQNSEHALAYHESALWSSFAFGNNLNASHADALESAIRGFLRSSLLSSGKVSVSALPGFNLYQNPHTTNTSANASPASTSLVPSQQLMQQLGQQQDGSSMLPSTTSGGSGNPSIMDTVMQRGYYPRDGYSLLPQKLLVGTNATHQTLSDAIVRQRQEEAQQGQSASFRGGSGGGGSTSPLAASLNNPSSQTPSTKEINAFNRLQILDGIAHAEKKLVSAIVSGAGTTSSPSTSSPSPIFPPDTLLHVIREILSKFHSWPEGRVQAAKLSTTALFDGLLRSIQSTPSMYPSFQPPSPATPLKARVRICSEYIFSLLAATHHQALIGYSECFLVYSVVAGQAPLGALKALPRLAERLFVRLQSNVSAGLLGGGGGDLLGGGTNPQQQQQQQDGGGEKKKKTAATKSSTATSKPNKDVTVSRDVFLRTVRDMFPRATEASLLALALLTFTESTSTDGGNAAAGGGGTRGTSSKAAAAAALALANQNQQPDAIHYVPYFKDRDHPGPGLVLTAIYRMALDEQRNVLEELTHALCQSAMKRYQDARRALEEVSDDNNTTNNNNRNSSSAAPDPKNNKDMEKFMSSIRAVSSALNNSMTTTSRMSLTMPRSSSKSNNNNKNQQQYPLPGLGQSKTVSMVTSGGVELFDENAIESEALVSLYDLGAAVFQINPHCPHKEMIKIVSVAAGEPNIETDYLTKMKTDPTAKLTMVNGSTGQKQPMQQLPIMKKAIRVADAVLRIRNVLFLEMFDKMSVEAEE